MLSDQLKSQIRAIHNRIKSSLPHYQARAGQNQLVAEIAKILAGTYHRHERIGLIEAGTGTGKSLAYMLAAIPYALSQKKKVVIATATVALQEQLVNKDLPFFQQHSKLLFEFCLVKGRQRYACIERLRQQQKHPELFAAVSDDVVDWQKLSDNWQQRFWLGDRDTLPIPLSDNMWQRIVADPLHCHKHDRRHLNCPFHLARAEIEHADVLVVNHALLLADLASGNSVLPSPDETLYIIDEAHHLPDIARDYFAAQAQLTHNSVWLEKAGKLVQQLIAVLPATVMKELLRFDDSCNELNSLLKPIERCVTEFTPRWFNEKTEYRFSDAALPKLFQQQAEQLSQVSQKALLQLDKIQQQLQENGPEQQLSVRQSLPMLQELSYLRQKIEQQQTLWQLYAVEQQKSVHQARWVALQTPGQHIIGHACPLGVAGKLEQLLFNDAFAVILCSATLTALNSFQYIRYDLGLTQFEGVKTLQVTSPFAYAEKGQIIIPKMNTEPTEKAYTDELAVLLPQYLPDNEGSLVLFASYWQMQQVAEMLRKKGFSLLVQGEASRQALLQLHAENCKHGKRSILFGTQSFSEGLDLPGKLLTNLVITKLPFAVPTSPLEEALAEAISRKGGNAFVQLTIPATAKKLVQACGRLLRQEQDEGRIIILDRRLVTKSYGPAMLNALPPFRRNIEY
ncbi:ATP-dependent DNA helicase DinG [Rheinheimera aquimaris]|uniref:ATP-dependent DNA helicase DinG n=1 Tax=Rheinheimera aquimaris TaxID=412437 RepID=A0ABN1E192_9GAMM|nr:ATP-dependent DNA helicase DinG [Rheinheimera aquimaris]MCB5214775.1 ATP-dependent DNA helicase DinG [Rheinheimera aquimaris]